LTIKRVGNHLGFHPLDFAPNDATTFALEEVLHEVHGDIFRQGQQRLRTDSFLARLAEG